MADIIAGTFFICSVPSDSEHFESLTDEQIEMYCEIFRYPERFTFDDSNIIAVPVKPANRDYER